jgi:hypothetical protein
MNRDLAHAFFKLRVSERIEVMKEIGITFAQGGSETNQDFSARVLQAVSNDGKVRELEQAMLSFQ